MVDQVLDAIHTALTKLKNQDGLLFKCLIEVKADYDARKLHEVCINHRLANYLEETILPLIAGRGATYFVDIEFNREGINFKNNEIDGQEENVRPDIIIHNRRSGVTKDNFLVVECKKNEATREKKEYDERKIKAFLITKKYSYKFGLQVIYSQAGISGTLYFIDSGNIVTEMIDV